MADARRRGRVRPFNRAAIGDPAPLYTIMRYKIEVQDETGIWSDVRGEDGNVLVYESEQDARAALAEKFPILVQMEKYAGGKRTRVIRILEDEDDWPAPRKSAKP